MFSGYFLLLFMQNGEVVNNKDVSVSIFDQPNLQILRQVPFIQTYYSAHVGHVLGVYVYVRAISG